MNSANQPEPSLRDQLYHAMGFCPRDDHECDWSPFLTDEEKLEQLLALFQAHEEAAVREARTNELNMFMDVNAQTVTDTQGSYIARRYQTLASTEFTRPKPVKGARDEH